MNIPAVKQLIKHTATSRLSEQQEQKPAIKSSLLWKISGKDLEKPSWLYGTMHVMCPEDLHFSDATLKALEQCRALYFETDRDMDNKQQTQANLKTFYTMPEGYSLKKLFTNEEYQQLRNWFPDSIREKFTALDRYKPVMLTFMISLQYMTLVTSCGEFQSCENELSKLAKAKQLPIFGLETVADQVAIFDSIPDKEEARLIMQSIRRGEKAKNLVSRLLNAYKAQEIDTIYQLMMTEGNEAKYAGLILDQRNIKWLPLITSQAEWTPTFFAVGAGHLGGITGLIALLRKDGYTVTPMQ